MEILIIDLELEDEPNIWRDKFNEYFNLIADELNDNTIKADGSRAMDSTLNMSHHRIVQQGAGVELTDGVNLGQLNAEVNKFTPSNKLKVHPSFLDGDYKYSTPDKALDFISGKSGAGTNYYMIGINHPEELNDYSNQSLVDMVPNIHLFAEDGLTPIYLGSTDIIEGTGCYLKDLVLVFESGALANKRLKGFKLDHCVIIVKSAADLELENIINSGGESIFIVQGGASIILIPGSDNNLHNCTFSTPLTNPEYNMSTASTRDEPDIINNYNNY